MSLCDLCLSCGAPFLPQPTESFMFNQVGTQSLLFLNMECQTNLELRAKFEKPTYASVQELAHVCHVSHHALAVKFMCNHHKGDDHVPNFQRGLDLNDRSIGWLFAFEVAPTGVNKKSCLAGWRKPSRRRRLHYRTLLAHITTSAADPLRQTRDTDFPTLQDEKYPACKGCNSIMTQESNFAYLVGYSSTANQNSHRCLIEGQPIGVVSAQTRNSPLANGLGRWRPAPGVPVKHPRRDNTDCASPHLAYYLHMCLPYLDVGGADPFNIPGAGVAARNLYIQLSWIILEIASLAVLMEEGKRYLKGKLSHGMQQHYGALDFYVSYFLWRLAYFDYKERIDANGLDFGQWHQKYYWDAINCSGLFPERAVSVIIGTFAYDNTGVDARTLVQTIAANLMTLYTDTLAPLIQFIGGDDATVSALPVEITSYFLPFPALRELKRFTVRPFIHFLGHF